MLRKKFMPLMLSVLMLCSYLPGIFTYADTDSKAQRTAYLHAQGKNPSSTPDVSTVYMNENTELYFAVDNPNKGDYDNGVHKEPQYDMNGYTLTIYFDSAYFDYASGTSAPIDYTVPGTEIETSGSGSVETGSGSVEAPTEPGYYVYRHETGSKRINGKTYKSASITVFFSGGYVPQKQDDPAKPDYQLWYNLCKLSLVPQKTGSTEVFFDTTGSDGESLELFAKNRSEELDKQTFAYTAVNGGYHSIIIKDKSKPSLPTANPLPGSYNEKQTVSLTAEEGCEIWYFVDGGATFEKYTAAIEIETTTNIICYAKRSTDGKQSNMVNFEYKILPKAPYLFVDSNGTKKLIPNSYSDYNAFTVYISDKSTYDEGNVIDAENEIYYTFGDLSAETITVGTDPETEWVQMDKRNPAIAISSKKTIRLITSKTGEFSEVAEYYLGIRPAKVTADHASGEYDEKIDITLSCETVGAKIYYSLDGSDPITNGMEYSGVITLVRDATLRAVSLYDGFYSGISSYYYIFKSYNDYGVDAFYPSGVYKGSVNVTLTANNPEYKIEYSKDGGVTWTEYSQTLIIDEDTDIKARAFDKNGNRGGIYDFTYRIEPLPPRFSPESTQFTNASEISIYREENDGGHPERFALYYTTDGSDPRTSTTRVRADNDTAIIKITKYTVISAVIKKDDIRYSSVVTHSYDIVSKKPVKPLMTLAPGNYVRRIGDDNGFETQFMPVLSGTDIFYTVSYDGAFLEDPIPNTTGTIKYDGQPIEVKGRTVIKAVAVNIFGIKSDIGIFEYTVTPEAPRAAPSAVIGGDKLPLVPVSAVKGCTVKYEINGFHNEFLCAEGNFYLDTSTGNAYRDKNCTDSLGVMNIGTIVAPAELDILAGLDGLESQANRYIYNFSGNADTLASPYADKETGEYEEIKADADNNFLHIQLYSLNNGDNIQYKTDNAAVWSDYDGNAIKIRRDTILQIRSEKDGIYSAAVSYVYHFVPLAPIITLPSGRYVKSDAPTTKIKLDDRAPSDENYTIWYRANGDAGDFRYVGQERDITHTMSFKAYVKNDTTGKVSKNTIHYYIIESDSAATGSVYIANPYDVPRISADVLNSGEYANGIKLLTQNQNAQICYFYSYTKTDGTGAATNTFVYDNAAPIMVNSSMNNITVTAWLEDADGRIAGSDFSHTIEFVHLEIPKTSLGSDKIEFGRGTKFTLLNDYPDDNNIFLYYTLDGSDPTDQNNTARKRYGGEEMTLNGAITIKTVYFSACGKCVECKNDNPSNCWYGVYGKTGLYRYTVPNVVSSGGGGGKKTIDNTRKYTKDIFGNEHPTHVGYINGYPDGSVKPDGLITREEITSILYRVVNHEYEKPFVASGKVFSDVTDGRWSAHDIEYMVDKDIIYGYPNGEFKPSGNLTRAEFAALISRFAKLKKANVENPFSDLESTHWAYDNILSLYASGFLDGYEDETYRSENEITRAEVMTVINKLLGRNPSESYVKSLEFNPFSDLEKDKWYYVAVLEATVTHNYYLNDKGIEVKWEDCR